MAIRKFVALFVEIVLLGASVLGQSLGDLAREQRQKQNDKPTVTPHKVITDDDIPAHTEASEGTKHTTAKTSSDNLDTPINTESNGEELKAKCLAIKQEIKDYQAQLDKLRASSKFVEANRYVNGAQYNQHQLAKRQEADRMEERLEQMKQKFADLQERARKAGFGSAVYDP